MDWTIQVFQTRPGSWWQVKVVVRVLISLVEEVVVLISISKVDSPYTNSPVEHFLAS